METNNIMIIIGCIISMIIIGIIFKISLLKIFKLIFNSILGAILIYCINKIGLSFGIHIGLNAITAIFVGIFGIPGAVLLVLLKIF